LLQVKDKLYIQYAKSTLRDQPRGIIVRTQNVDVISISVYTFETKKLHLP